MLLCARFNRVELRLVSDEERRAARSESASSTDLHRHSAAHHHLHRRHRLIGRVRQVRTVEFSVRAEIKNALREDRRVTAIPENDRVRVFARLVIQVAGLKIESSVAVCRRHEIGLAVEDQIVSIVFRLVAGLLDNNPNCAVCDVEHTPSMVFNPECE